MRDLYRFSGVILALLAFTQICWAGTTGKIAGTVTDKKTGQPLIGADVVLEGTQLGSSTDQDGFFMIINVPPGTYRLTVYYVGYTSQTIENVRVSIDRTTSLKIQLSPASVEGEEVVVEAERPAIEIDRTHSAAIINSETVEAMPVTEVEEVLELQAGVVSTDGELHFRGGRSREVTYIIDGVQVTNAFSQGGGSTVEVENNMIEELEVISGTFNAEYGRAQSGVVNIVTKKPSSHFRGNVQFYSGEWISSHDRIFLGIDDVNLTAEKDVQFSLSGPIIPNKVSFLVTGRYNDWEGLDWYERRFRPIDGWRIAAYQRWFQQHNPNQANTSGVITIPDSLATGDGARGPITTGTSISLNAKLIIQPISSLTLTYQIFGSFDDINGPYDPTRSGSDRFARYQPDEHGKIRLWGQSHFLKLQHVPSKRFYYNLAFSYQHNDGEAFYRKDNKIARFPGDDGIQPITSTSNGFSLGSAGFFYTDKEGKNYRDQYLFNGDLNWQIDKHNFIKAGFQITQHRINVYARGFRATQEWQNNAWPLQSELNGANMSFDAYWDSLVVYWQNWEQRFGAERFVAAADTEYTLFRDFNIEPLEAAFYVQDKLEMGDIIVNAGLRLDMFFPNERVPKVLRTESFNLGSEANLKDATTKYQLSPRLGISFPISSQGAFHAAYGHFFQMPAFQFMYNEPLRSLNRFQLEGRTLGNADLRAEKTIQYEVGLQQAITEDIAVDITAYYKDFRDLLGVEELTTLDAVSFRRFINRDYGNSKGITVGFTKRNGLVQGGFNYTLSFANGSSSDPTELQLIQTATQIGGQSDILIDRKILSLDWDQRHTINAYVNFIKSGDWSIGLVGFLNSGTPFTPTFVERFDIPRREYQNAAFKPTRWSVDLKAKKFFRILGQRATLFLKVDNLFDHLNHENVFSSTGRADEVARIPEELKILQETLEQEGLFTLEEIDLNPDNFSEPRKIQVGMEIKF
ncbi:MAG: TonB-dependent receptor [Calditrichaeota bacterium]|nr:MAG: TonB-dependent receptor [Calditrichota bacterium]